MKKLISALFAIPTLVFSQAQPLDVELIRYTATGSPLQEAVLFPPIDTNYFMLLRGGESGVPGASVVFSDEFSYTDTSSTSGFSTGELGISSLAASKLTGLETEVTNVLSTQLGELGGLVAAFPSLAVKTEVTQELADLAFLIDYNFVTKFEFYANVYNKMDIPTGTTTSVVNGEGTLVELPASAWSGSYVDLDNKPTLFDGAYASLSGKPTLFNGDYNSLSNRPTLFNGTYAALSGKPTLFSGNYNDLDNKPTLFNGDYNSLINKPTIPTLPTYSTVATSGSYNDLLNKPTIPADTQVLRVQTNSSGVYTWTFPNEYPSGTIPVISVNVENSSTAESHSAHITAVSHTSVTIKTFKDSSTTVLGIVVLGAPTSVQTYVHITARPQ